MSLSLTPFYAAPLVLLYIALSFRVIAYRRANKIPLGDAGNSALLSRIRAQGNCAEYMPLGLILLLMAELSSVPAFGFHLAALCLVVGRMVHAAHLSYLPNRYTMRVFAIVLTFTAYLLALTLAFL
jgi:uncharacterized protein